MTSFASSKGRPAVFLDRDGTLIEDVGYLYEPEKIKWLPGVFEGLRLLKGLNFKLIVVTNQSGVARGLYRCEDVDLIHGIMEERLARENASIDDYFYSPFHPEGTVAEFSIVSEMRKPGAGMIHSAAQRHGLDLSRSWMMGDSIADVGAARNAGIPIVILGNKALDGQMPDFRAGTFLEAVDWIRGNLANGR